MSAAAGPPALHRDTQRGLVAGVLAGLGGRIGLDPVLLRVLFVIAVIATGGLVLLLYLVAWAALPAMAGLRRWRALPASRSSAGCRGFGETGGSPQGSAC
jgi:phage shock protein PspC (stress-responsive transcriptional regulator)